MAAVKAAAGLQPQPQNLQPLPASIQIPPRAARCLGIGEEQSTVLSPPLERERFPSPPQVTTWLPNDRIYPTITYAQPKDQSSLHSSSQSDAESMQSIDNDGYP